MKLVRPVEVLDAVLIACNVVETPPAAYNGGTTYGLGASVSVAGAGGLISVYASLQALNTGHAPASSPAWWKLTGTTYGPYNPATSYALGDRVIEVAADSHHAYESLLASNVGNTPAFSPTNWLDLGATNRWRLFDGSVTSQTRNPDSIAATFQVPGRADSVALLNANAASARMVMTDTIEGVVYDQTFGLVSDSGITDWHAWFFEPIERIADLAVSDMPPYANAQLSVTLSDPGAEVACGACIVGLSRAIGATQYGAGVGIQDYSVKQRDAFGNYAVLERAFSKRATFSVLVANALVDQLQTLLAAYRATPILYLGSEHFASTILYGFYRDFSIVISYPDHALCSLEIEGLT